MKGRAPRHEEFEAAEVLRELAATPGGALTFQELADQCAIHRRNRPRFRRFLKTLLREGVLQPARGRGYRAGTGGSPRGGRGDATIEGVVRRHPHGFGFLIREDGDDLFLPVREMRDILDGDTVRALPRPGRYGRTAGRVTEIVARGRTTIVGRYERIGAREHVIPDPGQYDEPIELVPGAVQPRAGEIVEVEIRDFPQGRDPAVGRVVEILGAPGELGTYIETVIRRHGLPRRFPDDVLEEAESLPAGIAERDLAGRTDLRDEPTFTIDGEDARDFDDAVAIAARPDGGFRLRVSIADVAHWVRSGSPLDQEAFERGTSTYFPDRVIPMLPERLSNGLASLRPGEDRLTLTAEMDFDADGLRTHTRVFESVIRSHGRWTYTDVARVLDGEDVDGISEHGAHVQRMHELMARLRAVRLERGCLDLDLPEPKLILDESGQPTDVRRAERNDAHRMIEEFMLAANEAVADWFAERKRRTIYRVHAPPDPEKLRAFVEFARSWGHVPEFGGLASNLAIAEFLEGVAGAPAEHALHRILLRTMMRAEYAAENTGHYGLASSRYLHFTSPIRRYPDLIVHRLAKAILHGEAEGALGADLPRIAAHCSQRERRASQCEFDVVDVMRAYFLADRVGEEFDGTIVGVIENGFFVELLDVFVEGMVRVEDLPGDQYRFLPEPRILIGQRSKRRFALGDPVRIRVQAVHTAVGKVEFALLKGGSRSRRH
ncbi:ribonuclease R [bacterium]|nr:ribonuclease R [bacterium]